MNSTAQFVFAAPLVGVPTRWRAILSAAFSAAIVLGIAPQALAVDFGAAVANGVWSNPATWTPAGGPPGASDNAFIGSSTPSGALSTATVSLSANQAVNNLSLGFGGGANGTLDLGGFTLTVGTTLDIGPFGGVGTIARTGGGQFTAANLTVSSGNALTLQAADVVTSTLQATSGGQVTTATTANVSQSVNVFDAGSQLTLGADLSLVQDLSIRGTGATAATVDAAGFDITARDIGIGGFNNAGQILNRGVITATRNLFVDRSTFTFGASDSAVGLFVSSSGIATLDAATKLDSIQVDTGGQATTAATTNVDQFANVFNAGSQLTLGADLSLVQDLSIRGTGATAATVDAAGFDITARDIGIGGFNNVGQILNRGTITATRNLFVDRSTFVLQAGDVVTSTLEATSGGQVTTATTANVSQSVNVFNAGSQLTLGADLSLVQDLSIRGTGATAATVDAAGFDITARDIGIGGFNNAGQILNRGVITATRNLFVDRSTFTFGASDSAVGLFVSSSGIATLDAATKLDSIQVDTGGQATTAATTNVDQFANVFNAGSQLTLGADLSLVQDLSIRGTGATAATVDAAGFDITARDIGIGGFNNAGQILNRGVITATRNLFVDRSTFVLQAGDVVTSTLEATSGGQVTTATTANVSQSVNVFNAGSQLTLGADLSLVQDLSIRGTGATAATVDAAGFDITARDIFIGQFGSAGEIADVRNITANRVFVERSTLNLMGVNHQINAVVRLTTDSILNAAASGTVTITGGILGGLGTVQIGAGATLDLSPATVGSSAESLINNGAGLNLGANDFSVGVDYDNANFGVGNAFNARANVTGSGQILAENVFSISASGDVGGGTTIDFGNHRVGDVVNRAYQINHDGTAGTSPQVRTAIQTAAGGGNITDARLSGAGVTASNLAPIAAGGNSGALGVTFTASEAGALLGQTVHIEDNFDNVNGLTLSLTGAGYNPAVADVQPTSVNFGNFHVGDAVTPQAITITNLAAAGAFSEDLLANNFVATPDAFIVGGSPSSVQVVAGGGNNTLQVGFSTAAAGARTGSIAMDLTSTGEVNGVVIPGLGTLGLGQVNVDFSANVYRYAAPVVNNLGLGDFHVGDVAQGNVNVQNTQINDGFSESVRVATDSFAPDVVAAAGTTDVAPGANSGAALSSTISTATAGMKSGTVTYNLTSLAAAAGLNDTILAQQQATVTATVYRYAAPTVNNLPLGDFHVGDLAQGNINVQNTAVADGFSESLRASVAGFAPAVTAAAGMADVGPASNNSAAFLATLSTAAAGGISGTVDFDLTSLAATANLSNTVLAQQQAAVTANVYRYASPTVNNLDLGEFHVGDLRKEASTYRTRPSPMASASRCERRSPGLLPT